MCCADSISRPVVFLQKLPSYAPLPSTHISILDSLYNLSTTTNAEIRLAFYLVALRDPASDAARTYAPHAVSWVTGTDDSAVVKGRMKFCRPVFQNASKVDKDMCVKAFKEHKSAFHPIAAKMIEKVRPV